MVNENEIDKDKSLFFYFDLLLKNKYLILASVILSLIASYAYLQIRSDFYQIKYEFFTISKHEENKFIPINYFLIENGYDDTYNRKKIKNYFIEEFRNLEILVEYFGSIESANKISLSFENKENKNFIKLFSSNPEDDVQKIKNTIKKINSNVFDNIVNELDEIMRGKVFNIVREISAAQNKFEILEAKYFLEQDEYVNLLIEKKRSVMIVNVPIIFASDSCNSPSPCKFPFINVPFSVTPLFCVFIPFPFNFPSSNIPSILL